jgi:mRNA interferase MazF
LVVVAPITTTDRRLILQIPINPPEGGLRRPSFIMIDQVRTISQIRIGRRLGMASTTTMADVEDRLRYLLRL